MARWRFIAYPATNLNQPLGEITEATNKRITWRLDDAADASFTLDGRHELASLVHELTVDVGVWRDDELWFWGRLGSSNDNLDADEHTVEMSAVDYRGLLARRLLNEARSFTNVDQTSIARTLINTTQGLTGGNLGIVVNTSAAPNTGVNREIDYEIGKPVAEAINELSQLEDGFDWAVHPIFVFGVHVLIFQTFYPARGGLRDLVCEYGSTVTSVGRSFDPGEFANVVIVTGEDGTTPQTASAPNLTGRPEKRIEIIESLPDVNKGSILLARAVRAVSERSVIIPAYDCTMIPGVWTPRDLFVGDTTRLVIQSGRLDVNEIQRVTEITVTEDEDGTEEVTVSFDPLPRKVPRSLSELVARLKRLEKRRRQEQIRRERKRRQKTARAKARRR